MPNQYSLNLRLFHNLLQTCQISIKYHTTEAFQHNFPLLILSLFHNLSQARKYMSIKHHTIKLLAGMNEPPSCRINHVSSPNWKYASDFQFVFDVSLCQQFIIYTIIKQLKFKVVHFFVIFFKFFISQNTPHLMININFD
jgi:hypothetical protein